jgi:gas vesicle protein
VYLDENKIGLLDSMCMKLLIKMLPYQLESPYIIFYLMKRLRPGVVSTLEEKLKELIDTIGHVDILKQMQMLAKLGDLDEAYLRNTVIYEATKDYKLDIQRNIQKELDKFAAEIRGNWMKKLYEIQTENKELKQRCHTMEKTITTQLPSKAFCSIIYGKMDKFRWSFLQMLRYCFASGKSYIIRAANISKRGMTHIQNLIEKKMRGIKLREEEEAYDLKKMKETGEYWHAYIYQMIKQNEMWMKTYAKLKPRFRLMIVSEISKDVPELDKVDERKCYFNNKIQDIYEKYIPMLESQNSSANLLEEEEWEEDESEDAKVTDELVGENLKFTLDNPS